MIHLAKGYINMSKKFKVLVTSSYFPQKGLDLLKDKYELLFCTEEPPSKEELLQKVKNVDAIFWFSQYSVNQELLDAAGPNLKVVSALAVGYDNIDVQLLKSKNIKVGHTPNVLNDCVAEVAIGLALICAHRLQEGFREIVNGGWESAGCWNQNWLLGQQISGSVIGIVGLGRIGFEIGVRLKAFNAKRILYTGHKVNPNSDQIGAEFVSMNELLKDSDFVILACPLTTETRNLFNKELFNQMKSTAILVNISRGAVVNQDDLVDALTNKKIGGAALDVTTPEPLPPNHPLTKLSNCVISPHLGSRSTVTADAMGVLAASNIIAALEGKPMPAEVL